MSPSSSLHARIRFLRWFSVGLLLPKCPFAWTISSYVPIRLNVGALAYSFNCDDNDASCLLESLEQELDPARKEEIRMNIVRSLQNSFYSSASNSEDEASASNWSSTIVQNGGSIPHLPLFRVPWIEVIGRTNVLFIHEPMYTNMFEEILRAPSSPRWFGHLQRSVAEGASGSSNSAASPLQAWNAASLEDEEDHVNPSYVLGTLMNITDFRRMKDGQLLLLVQAMERFVVTEVHQTLPYGVATAQLLPDIEELQLRPDRDEAPTEALVRPARTRALAQAQQTWWPYEFAGTPLPLPSDPRTPLAWSDVVGTALAQVVPFAALQPDRYPISTTDELHNDIDIVDQQTSPPLEVCLLERGILSEEHLDIPPSLRQTDSTAELEMRLWLVLNDYFTKRRNGGASIPSHLLGWLPSSFRPGLLASIANVLERDGQLVSVPADYPDLRRQKRLSYAAAQLLEGLGEDPEQGVSALRQTLLQIPSTRLRLAYVVARWEEVWKKGLNCK
jgi:Lon protease-like protein